MHADFSDAARSMPSRFLQLLEKFASRAGNEDAAGNSALAVFHALYDASGLSRQSVLLVVSITFFRVAVLPDDPTLESALRL